MSRVMVFGTFDRLHAGHLDFLSQARAYGDGLIAVIGRDATVQKLKHHAPLQSEQQRVAGVFQSGLADQVVLGSLTDYFEVLEKFQPDIICLGYDQDSPMSQELPKRFPHIRIVRLNAFQPDIYKSSKMRDA